MDGHYTVKANSCFRQKGKTGEERNLVILKDTHMNLNNHFNGELSTRHFYLYVCSGFVLKIKKNYQYTLFPCFTSYLQQVGLPKKELVFTE